MKLLCKVGGATMLAAVLLAPAEVVISFLPGTQSATAHVVAVQDWFILFRDHWFLGLRNLGLLNMIGAALLAPAILAIYFALRREAEVCALAGVILAFAGMTLYLANNPAFSMLSLSRQYASAGTDLERAQLEAAGQALLAMGRNRAGLALVDLGCLALSAALLKSNVFSKAAAWVGMLGNALMFALEVVMAMEGKLSGLGMAIAAPAGISLMAWYVLTGRRLLQFGIDSLSPILTGRVAQGAASG
jgi:hypothetical protein